MKRMRSATIALLFGLGVLGCARRAAAGSEEVRQTLGQDLIRCAAFRSYQKLCLQADAGADNTAQVQALNTTIKAFLHSARSLLVEDELVFPPYQSQLQAIRTALQGRCTEVQRLDEQEYAQCTAYEHARTDPRNPWGK